MLQPVTKRYTQALFDLSQETGACKSVYEDLQKIQNLITDSSELKEFLKSPGLPLEKRQAVLVSIFESKIGELSYRFICFLNSRNRLGLLEDVSAIFEDLYFTSEGIVKIDIKSSIALTKQQTQDIVDHLKLKFNKDIGLRLLIDPRMLGGIRFRKDSTIYDYSLRTQLKRFKRNVIKA